MGMGKKIRKLEKKCAGLERQVDLVVGLIEKSNEITRLEVALCREAITSTTAALQKGADLSGRLLELTATKTIEPLPPDREIPGYN